MGSEPKPVYIYLIPKSEWPAGRVDSKEIAPGIIVDKLNGRGKVLGVEILDTYQVEVDGKEVGR